VYLFWDGESLGATNITIDPEAYSDPPYLDPSLFTKDTKLADLVELLGSDYTEVDQSYFSSVIGDANFKTYFFRDEGLFIAFLDGSLVSVQTIDIPESNTPASSKIMSSMSRKGEDIVALAGTISDRALMVAMIVTAVIAHELYPELTTFSQEFWTHCNEALDSPDIVGKAPADCTRALVNEFKEAKISLVATILAEAEMKCGNQQASLPQSVPFLSAGDFTAAAADQFPYCPGTQIKCTDYTYSPWSACGSDGKQTREATKIPPGCNIDPPSPPETTKQCILPCTDYTYSPWSACGSDGFKTRYTTGKIPSGCDGEPSKPPETTQSCTPPVLTCPSDYPVACPDGYCYLRVYKCCAGGWACLVAEVCHPVWGCCPADHPYPCGNQCCATQQ